MIDFPTIGASVAASALVVWFFRTWISERLRQSIKHEYDHKLELHKAELRAAHDLELERLRSSLERRAHEHRITFTRLHERRVETVAEIYGYLQDVDDRLDDLLNNRRSGLTDQTRKTAFYKLHLSCKKFTDHFHRNKIWLPAPVSADVYDYAWELAKLLSDFVPKWLEVGHTRDDYGLIEAKMKERRESVDPLLKKLESVFRNLVGEQSGGS